MKTIRQLLEEQEELILSPQAMKSCNSRGRKIPEEECTLRPAFQHDRDRIIHSKSFRRLKHKTQVFLSPSGDHYRTRLTHTLEVAQIARTISKSLHLNEDLTEAVALAHDLGHTPFGHAGEEVLSRILPDGFSHYKQSFRVVDCLEKEGRGLNLTYEVLDGILLHSKGKGKILPDSYNMNNATWEAQVVRIADIIAYTNHDIDDAVRAGVISENDIPEICHEILGVSHAKRIDTMVRDVISSTIDNGYQCLTISENVEKSIVLLRDFLYDAVYENKEVHTEFEKAAKVLTDLYNYFISNPDFFYQKAGNIRPEDPLTTKVGDFIAGMSDRYALDLYERLFLPQPWIVF